MAQSRLDRAHGLVAMVNLDRLMNQRNFSIKRELPLNCEVRIMAPIPFAGSAKPAFPCVPNNEDIDVRFSIDYHVSVDAQQIFNTDLTQRLLGPPGFGGQDVLKLRNRDF